MIALAVRSGISDLRTIQEVYNTYAQGGDLLEEDNIYAKGGKIHIKPENRGKFTALKERTGHSASWFKENGTPAQKRMAVFALNAAKWNHKHADGGPIDDGYTKKYIRRPGQGNVRTYDQRHLVQDVPQPEYNIFEDKSSFGRRDAHLKSLDNFIANNPTAF